MLCKWAAPCAFVLELLLLLNKPDWSLNHSHLQGAGFTMIEAQCNVVERWCSMTARSVMDIPPAMQFYFFISNSTAKLINLPKLMIFASASSVPTCIINARDDEPYISRGEGQVLTKCQKLISDPNVNADCYLKPLSREQQVDQHNTVKISEKIRNRTGKIS